MPHLRWMLRASQMHFKGGAQGCILYFLLCLLGPYFSLKPLKISPRRVLEAWQSSTLLQFSSLKRGSSFLPIKASKFVFIAGGAASWSWAGIKANIFTNYCFIEGKMLWMCIARHCKNCFRGSIFCMWIVLYQQLFWCHSKWEPIFHGLRGCHVMTMRGKLTAVLYWVGFGNWISYLWCDFGMTIGRHAENEPLLKNADKTLLYVMTL